MGVRQTRDAGVYIHREEVQETPLASAAHDSYCPPELLQGRQGGPGCPVSPPTDGHRGTLQAVAPPSCQGQRGVSMLVPLNPNGEKVDDSGERWLGRCQREDWGRWKMPRARVHHAGREGAKWLGLQMGAPQKGAAEGCTEPPVTLANLSIRPAFPLSPSPALHTHCLTSTFLQTDGCWISTLPGSSAARQREPVGLPRPGQVTGSRSASGGCSFPTPNKVYHVTAFSLGPQKCEHLHLMVTARVCMPGRTFPLRAGSMAQESSDAGPADGRKRQLRVWTPQSLVRKAASGCSGHGFPSLHF